MKVLLFTALSFLSSSALAFTVELTPVTMSPPMPVNNTQLHRDFQYQERMIAQVPVKKKKTWSEDLQTKLKGYKGDFRF